MKKIIMYVALLLSLSIVGIAQCPQCPPYPGPVHQAPLDLGPNAASPGQEQPKITLVYSSPVNVGPYTAMPGESRGNLPITIDGGDPIPSPMRLADGENVWQSGKAPYRVTEAWNRFKSTGQGVSSKYAGFGGAYVGPCPVCHASNRDAAAEVAQFAVTTAALSFLGEGVGKILSVIGAAGIPETILNTRRLPFNNVIGTTATFQLYGTEPPPPGAWQKFYPSRSKMVTTGGMGTSDYTELTGGEIMVRFSDHWPVTPETGGGTSNWTTDGSPEFSSGKMVAGWVRYEDMLFPDGTTPLTHRTLPMTYRPNGQIELDSPSGK